VGPAVCHGGPPRGGGGPQQIGILDTIDEAVDIANDTEYGLSGASMVEP
jgi:hypothetical protein